MTEAKHHKAVHRSGIQLLAKLLTSQTCESARAYSMSSITVSSFTRRYCFFTTRIFRTGEVTFLVPASSCLIQLQRALFLSSFPSSLCLKETVLSMHLKLFTITVAALAASLVSAGPIQRRADDVQPAFSGVLQSPAAGSSVAIGSNITFSYTPNVSLARS